MRSVLALGLLISLCASANAATVHHSRRHHHYYGGGANYGYNHNSSQWGGQPG